LGQPSARKAKKSQKDGPFCYLCDFAQNRQTREKKSTAKHS